MFKKILAVIFISFFIFAGNLKVIPAQTITADNSPERIKLERLKTKVYRFGRGEKAKVVVNLKDGKRLKGYITQTIEDSFDIANSKTKEITTIPYRDVAQVKKQGLSKGAKIAVGVGLAAAITVLVITHSGKKLLDGFLSARLWIVLIFQDINKRKKENL